jgi:hypothetical protein
VALHCGLEDVEGREALNMSTAAALMGVASAWRIPPQLFASPRLQFEPEDADRHQVLVCLDDAIQAEVLRQLSAFPPANAASYTSRVCSLTDFVYYVDDARLLQNGGSGLLDKGLRELLRLRLPRVRPALAATLSGAGAGGEGEGPDGVALPRYPPSFVRPTAIPRLSIKDSPDSWEDAMLLTAVCAAGLHQYLIDSRPDDLPEYDPVD